MEVETGKEKVRHMSMHCTPRFPQAARLWRAAPRRVPAREANGGANGDQAPIGVLDELLPMGDGSHFVALNAKVRRANRLELGDSVTVRFKLR